MILHLVFFKLNPEVDDAKLGEIIETTRSQLGAISHVSRVQAGRNAVPDDEWPFFLSVELESMEALEAYRVDPLHVAYLDSVIKPFTKDRKALDFDI
ncbi:MAG: hypothetical protein GWQ08_18520 [Verrucomicrobiaceae bacterium]|nr:hypothetical protein [Verrucomicrobiaceae bacterium]